MIKNLKGNYNSGTDYSVGDVVKTEGRYYLMIKDGAAGTHPFETEYWNPIVDPDTIDALDIAEDALSSATTAASSALEAKFPDAKTLVLASSTASSTKKFKITVVDAGTISATEITST